ncbi:MAG: class I SAM-dependent methyltransferase [Anaerolineae bacterium]|nr:class I SAM-dependent methyltransferase [Anaerolineae bacterium]NUQ03684.1 class I SAM-dependent methyltransferase [Anaerolineae bacterium]
MQSPMVEATHQERRVQSYYTWRASNYDAATGFEAEHHLEAIRRAAIREGQHVLEAACGTGRATVDLADAVGASGRVDALDLTDAMLDQARAKIDQRGFSSRVHFKQGNAKALPYPDASFDVLYNGYMFDLIPFEGFLPILTEFRRVLKPGGRLVLVNMSKPDSRKTFFERLYERGWAVMPCRPVLMSSYLEPLGFTGVQRLYRPSRGRIVSKLWGQEIVLANKAQT